MKTSKQKLFIDMDGVIVNFKSGLDRMSDAEKKKYEKGSEDDCPNLFARMDPMSGAINALKSLVKIYDVYILSTAPWKNPTAWDDKRNWVDENLSEIKNEEGEPYFRKRLILTHNKELLNDGESWLVDDRDGHGACMFGQLHIKFGADEFSDWDAVADFLINYNR